MFYLWFTVGELRLPDNRVASWGVRAMTVANPAGAAGSQAVSLVIL